MGQIVLLDTPFITAEGKCVYLFSCSYMMSNGYKPSPLDLSDIKLSPGQELLVDKLAENAHNVWAKDRIKQGWTYGIQQVRCMHSVCWTKASCYFGDKNLFLKGIYI